MRTRSRVCAGAVRAADGPGRGYSTKRVGSRGTVLWATGVPWQDWPGVVLGRDTAPPPPPLVRRSRLRHFQRRPTPEGRAEGRRRRTSRRDSSKQLACKTTCGDVFGSRTATPYCLDQSAGEKQGISGATFSFVFRRSPKCPRRASENVTVRPRGTGPRIAAAHIRASWLSPCVGWPASVACSVGSRTRQKHWAGLTSKEATIRNRQAQKKNAETARVAKIRTVPDVSLRSTTVQRSNRGAATVLGQRERVS